MPVIFDRSPQVVHFKMMAGATLIQEFLFFENSNPLTPNENYDIRNFNFRMTGRLLGNNVILPDSIFDANIVFGSTGNRNGLWLSEGTQNRLIFFYDWVSDAANVENAQEGIFQFKLWETDSFGVDTCIAVLEYDMKHTNTIDDILPASGDIIHITRINQISYINLNVKLVK